MSVTGVAIGVGTIAAGAISASSERSASGKRRKAEKAELAFQKEQYDRWVDIYGDVEANVGEFYDTLTPEYITSQGLEQQQAGHQEAIRNIREQFAQSDVTAGAQADILARGELSNARERARIRTDAPLKAIEQKQSFIALGRNVPTGYGESLQSATATAGQSERQQGRQWSEAAQTLGQVGGEYYARKDRQNTADNSTESAINSPTPFVDGGE